MENPGSNLEKSQDALVVPREEKSVFIYLFFYFVGLTILFPYSMLITINDFWNYKFRDTSIEYNSTNDELTELQKSFPGFLSISGNVPLTVLSIVTALFGNFFNIKTRLTKLLTYPSYREAVIQKNENIVRLLVSAVLMGLAFGGTTVISGLNTDSWQNTAFILIMVINSCYSAINAVFQTSFLGNLGRFPPRYIGCTNDGMGLGATLPAIINIIIIATKPDREEATDWNDLYFTPVCCFLLQAVSDWAGRTIATVSQWPKPGKSSEYGVLVLSIARIGFIPLLMMCNVAPENRNTNVVFASDYSYIIILILLSVSGGFLGNVCQMLGPKKVSGYHQETAGILQTISLVFGLGVGSLVGPALVQLL